MPKAEDMYEILHLHQSAHPDVIQAAYRRLALLYHPDKNPSLEATETMAALNRAYAILSDRDQRAEYDRQRSVQAGLGRRRAPATGSSRSSPSKESTPRNPSGYFTRGSTKSEVADIHGPPDDVSIDQRIREEVWYYGGDDTIEFDLDSGKVQGWSNIRGNLRIRLVPGPNVRPNIDAYGYFEVGDHRGTVAHLQRTPPVVIASREVNREIWVYPPNNFVEFNLVNGRVTDWQNSDGKLKAKASRWSGDWLIATNKFDDISVSLGGSSAEASRRSTMLLAEFDGRELSLSVYWGSDVTDKSPTRIPVHLQIDIGRRRRKLWHVMYLQDRTDVPPSEVAETLEALFDAKDFIVTIRPAQGAPITTQFKIDGFREVATPVLEAWKQAGSPLRRSPLAQRRGCLFVPIAVVASASTSLIALVSLI